MGFRWKLLREIAPLILISALLAMLSGMYIYSKQLNGPPIRSDGFGYYAYLPSVFIDHNIEFDSALRNMPAGMPSFAFGINRVPETGHYFNKYAIGTAVLQSPFFLGAHMVARWVNAPQSGYSRPYQVGNTVSAIFYLCLGMFFLYSALRTMHSSKVAIVTVALIVFATNVFHYASYDASFSHVYEFALASVLLYLLLQVHHSETRLSPRVVVSLGLVTGLIALTRLTNITFAILPVALFAERWISGKNNFRTLLGDCLLAGIAALCVLFPQLLYWKSVTGHWVVNAYMVVGEDAKFYWSKPELFNFLFSIRKGAVFWTPLLVVGIVGFPRLIRRSGLLGWAMGLVLCLQIYICASWYCWSFGGSFGSRPMVDVMPIVAISVAMIVGWLWERRQIVTLACVASILVVINLTLMYSYWRGYIPFDNADLSTLTALPSHLWSGGY